MLNIERTIPLEDHINNIIRSLRDQGLEYLSDQCLHLIDDCTKFTFCTDLTVRDFAAFRARKNIDETTENIEDSNTFSCPNPIFCNKNGRANIARKPVFYSAENMTVALNEVWPRKGDIIYVSIWHVTDDVSTIRMYVCLSDDVSKDNAWYGAHLGLRDTIKRELDLHARTSAIALLKTVAQAFFSETYPYLISSTAAYLLLYAYRIDALVYPSFSWHARFCNYALSPEFVSRNLEIARVYKLHVRESAQVADVLDLVSVGIFNGVKIVWREPDGDDYQHCAGMCPRELAIPLLINGPDARSELTAILESYSREEGEDVSRLDVQSDPDALVRIAAVDDEAQEISELRSYLARYPNCHLGCFLMASWANDHNNFYDAIHYYTRAINILPGQAKYHYNNRGNAFFKLGRLAEALADYSEAIQCSASQGIKASEYLVKSYCNRGSVYQQMGSFGKAAADFRIALQYDSRDYFSHFNLGNCLLLEDRYEEAIESYENAVEIRQDDGEVYYNRLLRT